MPDRNNALTINPNHHHYKKSAQFVEINAINKKNPTWYVEDLEVLMAYLAQGKIKPVIASPSWCRART
jgi:mannose-6-phosphate isomerase-like protein (cupin superfamily)